MACAHPPPLWRRLLADWTPFAAARLAAACVNLLLLLVMVRVLAPERVGLFHFLATAWGILAVLVDLGGDATAVREMARRPGRASAVFAAYLALKRRTVWLGALCFAGLVLCLVEPGPWQAFCFLSLPVLAGHYGGSYTAVLRVRHRLGAAARAWLAGQGLFLCAGLAALLLPSERQRFAGLTAAYGLSFAAGGWLIRQAGRPLLEGGELGRRVRPWRFARRAWPQGVAALAGILYFYQDTLFLQGLSGARATGTYGVAYRLLNVLVYGATALGAAALPLLSRTLAWPDRFARLLRALVGAALVGGTGMAAVGAPLAGPILEALYGERLAGFPGAAGVLRVLFLALLLLYPGAVLTTALVARAPARWARLALAGVGVNGCLNLVLIPSLGPLGAAWATVATEGFVTAWAARSLWGAGLRPLPLYLALRLLACGAFGAAAAALTRPLGLAPAGGLGLLAYGLALGLCRALPSGLRAPWPPTSAVSSDQKGT